MKYYPFIFRAEIIEIKKRTKYYNIVIADYKGLQYKLAVPKHIKKEIGNHINVKRVITDRMELFDYYYEVIS